MGRKKIILKESQLDRLIPNVRKSLNEMRYKPDMVFITYGSDSFDADMFNPIDYSPMTDSVNKCSGGLWASPLNSNWGWKHWCEQEDWDVHRLSRSFTFQLSSDAKIYEIDNEEDLKRISTRKSLSGEDVINWKQLLDAGYDGIYVSEDAVRKLRYSGLYTWDVESLCVFNKDVIIPITIE